MLLRLLLLLLCVAILTVAVVAALLFAAALRHGTPAEVVLHSYKQQYSSSRLHPLVYSSFRAAYLHYIPFTGISGMRKAAGGRQQTATKPRLYMIHRQL